MKMTHSIKLATMAAIITGSFAAMQASHAGTSTANVGISTTVIANCSVTSTAVGFGNYDPLAAGANTATGTVVLTCSQGATPSVALSMGANASGSRRMADGSGNFLPYSIFKPTANTANASCASASTAYDVTAPGFALTAAPDTSARTFNLCGSIAPGQSIPLGAYSDTVVATITF
jgi:spore coat protein U-like protein